MADTKISALTSATTPLAGTEVLPIVQSGATVKVAVNNLTVQNVRANATTGILQVTGPAAASTRVMTVPDANFTAARTDAAQTFTGAQTFTNGILMGATAAPAFSAYGASAQSINNNTLAKLIFDTEEFDTNNNFDTALYGFFPTVAGYYQVNSCISWGTSATGVVQIHLYKNGSLYKRGVGMALNAVTGCNISVSSVLYLDGVSDYVEVYCYQDSGGALNTNGGANTRWFNGALIRSA
jgi:hypothetical protein